MKKLFKVFVAGAIIVVLAVVALNVFGRKNENAMAYSNVLDYNTNVIRGEVNVVEVVNSSLEDMLEIIRNNNLDMGDEEEFLSVFLDAQSTYSVVESKILKYGIFVNKANNGTYVKKMNESFSSLKKLYNSGYDYLEDTYLKISDGAYDNIQPMQAYISNFVQMFKCALEAYNQFFYNAGMVFANGTQNLFDTNNLDKLYMICYLDATNNLFDGFVNSHYAQPVIVFEDLSEQYQGIIDATANKINAANYDKYIANYQTFDTLLSNIKKIKTGELIRAYVKNSMDDYYGEIETSLRSLSIEFLEFVVEG